MGNKHGTLSLGRCRDKHRADARSRNWSFHSMDNRRVGSTPRSQATSSVSIHTSGGQSFVKYHARGGSTIRSAATKASLNRDDEVDRCSGVALVVRSLSAPAHDVGGDSTALDTDETACSPGSLNKPACLGGDDYTVHNLTSTPSCGQLPVDLESLQQKWAGSSSAPEDPWVMREERFQPSVDSTRSDREDPLAADSTRSARKDPPAADSKRSGRKDPPCRRKLFDDIARDSCKDNVTDSLGAFAKQKMKNTFSKHRNKNKLTLKGRREGMDLITQKEGTEKTTEDASPHRLKALSYLSKIWQERLKSSSNRLRAGNGEQNMCASDNGVARIKSAKVSQSAHNLSSGNSEKTCSVEILTCFPTGERDHHSLTNQNGRQELPIGGKIFDKNNGKQARLYKSSDTIINRSTDTTVNETNKYLETQVNREFLPSSASEQLIPTSGSVLSLLAKNKRRNLSSSSADSSDNLVSKPPRHPSYHGFLPSRGSASLSNLHLEPVSVRRTRRELEEHRSFIDRKTRQGRNSQSRRSQQCFSLNLDTFTEEFLNVNPASLLDLAVDQITDRTASTRIITIDSHSGSAGNEPDQSLNGKHMTAPDKSDSPFILRGNNSTQGPVMTEIGKLNSTRSKLNLPVGRSRQGKASDSKPFYCASNADPNHLFVISSLTTTPTTTDSGYNTESSFSCEKTPKLAKIYDSPISEILYYNVVDEEDLEEPFSISRNQNSDQIANNCKHENSGLKELDLAGDFDNLKTTEGEKGNRDRVTNESRRTTLDLFVADIKLTNCEFPSKTNESRNLSDEEWRDFSRQINDWHMEFAKTGQVNDNVNVTDTVEGRMRSGVKCDSFDTGDSCDVKVFVGNNKSEEMKRQVFEIINMRTSQTRDPNICGSENIRASTSRKEHFSATRILLSGGTSCTATIETKAAQTETNFLKQERNSVTREDLILEIANYRQEEKQSTKQEVEDFAVRAEILQIQENMNRIDCDLKGGDVCQSDDGSVRSYNSSTTNLLPSAKMNQQERLYKEKNQNYSTDLNTTLGLVNPARPCVESNTGCNCARDVSSNNVAMVDSDIDKFDECISSSAEVSQITRTSTRADNPKVSSEVVSLIKGNDNEMCPPNLSLFPVKDNSILVDSNVFSGNGCEIGLVTSQKYSANPGENYLPNGTGLDGEIVFSLSDGERKGGNDVIENQDQSTVDNSTYVCCGDQNDNLCDCIGDGVVSNICEQTSFDTLELREQSGIFSSSQGSRHNSNVSSTVVCDESISKSVSLLSEQLRSKSKCSWCKKEGDITTQSTTHTEELTLLDATPSSHNCSHVDSIKDISESTIVCDDGSISTNPLTCKLAEIVSSGSEEWRCSTPCFSEQSSRSCLENLVRCFQRISEANVQKEQQLESSHSRTSSTSEIVNTVNTDLRGAEAFIDKLNRSDNFARFLKEQSQPEVVKAAVDQVDQSSISELFLDQSSQCNISGSFTDNRNESVSFGGLGDILSQPVIPESFTKRLSQCNNYNTSTDKLNNGRSHKTSVDNLAQVNIASDAGDKSSQPSSSDTFREPPRKHSDRFLKTLSVSDSNLPNSLVTDALNSTPDQILPKPRKKPAFRAEEIHKKHETSLVDGDLLYPLSELKPYNACPLSELKPYNVCNVKNYAASDFNLYFSEDTKSRRHGLYILGSDEMLNSGFYDNNVSHDKYKDDGRYGKKVASCTNLAEQSRARSRIAMGMASARMRSNASPARSVGMDPSLRMTHSASPTSSRSHPESSSTSEIDRSQRPRCLLGISHNRQAAGNTGGLRQDLPAAETSVKHSRSLDMYMDRTCSPVCMHGGDGDQHVSDKWDHKPVSFNILGERYSSNRAGKYRSEPDSISNACVGRYRLNQLSSSKQPFKMTATTNDHIGNIDKISQVVCKKDLTKSAFCHSYHTALNNDKKYNLGAAMRGNNFAQLESRYINSSDIVRNDNSKQANGIKSLPIIGSHSNNPLAEMVARTTSVSGRAANTLYPSTHGPHNDSFSTDPYSTVPCRRDPSPVVEPSSLRQSRPDRLWNYSMTSLTEEITSREFMCAEGSPGMDTGAAEVCPSCQRPFDGGRRRRLIDSCGHERCYSCMFNNEVCSVCAAHARISFSRPAFPPSGYQPSANLNHDPPTQDPPEIPPRLRRPAASPDIQCPPPLPRKFSIHHQSPVHYSNQSLIGSKQAGCKSPVLMGTPDLHRESESPPPPPPDVAQHDLMMRLGLLLGDPIHPSGITGVGVVLSGSQQGETTLNSISSLSSNEHTPEKCVSDSSPMSSLTACIPTATEDIPLFGSKRNVSVRRSARVSVNGRRAESRTKNCDHLQLKPLLFDIPHPEGKPIFVGRAWLFNKLEATFRGDECGAPKSNGVIITGAQGTGKTAIVEQLINHSCFSNDITGYNSSRSQDKLQSHPSHGTKLTDYMALNGLGFQVVAYHVCQADNSSTCMVADMVSSMAAQMAKAPQLVAYHELLLQEPYLQSILSPTECTQNPSLSFLKGILEPLRMLKNTGKIFTDCCIILVDSLNEAEFHKPDHGDTIASFLCHHACKFPDWLKLVVTVQSSFQEITSSLPFSRISLDQHGNYSDHVSTDIVSYIDHRISISSNVRANISVNGRPNKELTSKFISHVHTLSNGSFLYARLVLDLIENGHLIPKSSSYAILPVNLSEVFLLHFNLKFSSVRAFERVSSILAVCLASLYPLKLVDIFLTVNSGYVHQYLSWEDFIQRMDVLAGFIYSCHDNTVKFFHPAFREWLIHRDEADSPKFLCDLRHGHALMAFRLSRVSAPLSPDKTIEFGHHILKAHIYKSVSRQLGYSSQNVQAYWMCLSSCSLNAALVSHRNVYSPNVKVSRLILLSGGNPNSRTEYLGNAPILCVAAREGYMDMLSLLLEFGADPNVTSDTGMSPLCYGAVGGHVEVVRMLCLHNVRVRLFASCDYISKRRS